MLTFSKDSAAEIRITAIRFGTPATVPVKVGSSVDLIPLSITSGTPSVANQPLKIGQYVRLSEAAPVEPGFVCLLLLAQ